VFRIIYWIVLNTLHNIYPFILKKRPGLNKMIGNNNILFPTDPLSVDAFVLFTHSKFLLFERVVLITMFAGYIIFVTLMFHEHIEHLRQTLAVIIAAVVLGITPIVAAELRNIVYGMLILWEEEKNEHNIIRLENVAGSRFYYIRGFAINRCLADEVVFRGRNYSFGLARSLNNMEAYSASIVKEASFFESNTSSSFL
jgi:hypothetical protein